MKLQLKKIFLLFVAAITITACSTGGSEVPEINELEGLTKINELTNATHTIELYSEKGSFTQGYNDIKLRIKENSSGNYIKNATVNWKPLMHMTSMTHSCPTSLVTKESSEKTLFEGYIMFQMPSNNPNYWDLQINYTINGTDYTMTSEITVLSSAKRVVNSFTGSDGKNYLLTYIEPIQPKVAINELKIGVWEVKGMMSYPIADGLTVKIDPRMPSMGNHSSPNNVDATQNSLGSLYEGKLSLTMTGLWKINLQLAKADGTILKGESITDTNELSSIFFEIEF